MSVVRAKNQGMTDLHAYNIHMYGTDFRKQKTYIHTKSVYG